MFEQKTLSKILFSKYNKVQTYNGVVTSTSASDPNWVLPWVDSRTGVELPNYNSIIESGGDATTSFDAVRYGMSVVETKVLVKSSSKSKNPPFYTVAEQITGAGWLKPTLPTMTVNFTTADNLALQALYKNILKITTSVDGMMIIGELSETIGMLRKPLNALRHGYSEYLTELARRLKRLPANRGKNPQIVMSMLSGTYLEYVFGWANTIRDINGVMSAINKKVSSIKTFRIQGNGQADQFGSATQRNLTAAYFFKLIVNESESSINSVRYTVGFRPDQFDSSATSARLFGFAPERFVPTLWEIMPWSWMIDYFINIGSIIEAICSLKFKPTFIARNTRSVTTKYTNASVNDAGMRASFGTDFDLWSGQPGNVAAWRINVSRRKLTQLPIPKLELEIPDYWKQWLNMSAVGAQRVNLQKLFNAIPHGRR